jgi:hypothetical protein
MFSSLTLSLADVQILSSDMAVPLTREKLATV